MNNARRKDLRKLIARLEKLDFELREISSALENLITEEEEAYDNLPEGIQASERGEQMQEIIDQLYDAQSNLDDIQLEEVYNQIEEAIG